MRLTIFRKGVILVSLPFLVLLAVLGLLARGEAEYVEAQRALILARDGGADEERLAELERLRTRLYWLLGIGAGLGLSAVIGLAAFFSSGISSRFRVLVENTRRFTREEPLLPVPGSDEIAELDRAFRQMARQIEEAVHKEREYAQVLVNRVAERTAELSELNRQLVQQNQENEMFVYSVSHDLRSPLVNLQGFSRELTLSCRELHDLLADERTPPAVRDRGRTLVDGDIAESIRFIQTAVTRLSGIIDALLRLSRAGRVQYQLQRVDVTATVRRVVDSFRGTVAERRAEVTVRDLPPAWGDPTALEQLFANLIGNALNYLDPARAGAVEIGAVTNPGGVGERVLTGDSVTYYVKDNGLGIPAAYRDKVFRAFQRLHPEAARGEGMGLTIVHRIVERHGGALQLDSVEGKGTTFFVTLAAPPKSASKPGL